MKSKAEWFEDCGAKGSAPPKSEIEKYRLHSTWYHMLSKCYNTEDRDYDLYGAQGATVCERWKNLDNFVADIGSLPLRKNLRLRLGEKTFSPETTFIRR